MAQNLETWRIMLLMSERPVNRVSEGTVCSTVPLRQLYRVSANRCLNGNCARSTDPWPLLDLQPWSHLNGAGLQVIVAHRVAS
jgi:hypothetical protein